jgi:hypothetical protein
MDIKIKIQFKYDGKSTVSNSQVWATIWDGKGHSCDVELDKNCLSVEELQIQAIKAANDKAKEWAANDVDANSDR